MQLAVVARWGVRAWLQSGIAWLLAALALLIGPLSLLSAPWGIVEHQGSNGRYVASIWYVSCYLGAAGGLVLLGRAGGIWNELGRGRQVLVAAVILAALSVGHGLLSLGSLAVLGEQASLPKLQALACAVHWAVIGAFVQRTQFSTAEKLVGISALGWWLPALLGGASGWERLRWLFGPECRLEAAASASQTSLSALVDTIPLVAWWVAAALLPTRSALRR